MAVYYLELSSPADHSHKFYEITVDQQSLILRFGRIGTAGTQQIKVYPTSDIAQEEAQKKCQAKQKKGYQLISQSSEAIKQKDLHSIPSKTAKSVIPQFSDVDLKTKPFPVPILWRFNSGFSSFGLAVENGNCWLGNEKGRVLKLDQQGQVLEQYQLPWAVKSIVADDIWLYVGCDNGTVYDMTGKMPYLAYEVESAFNIFALEIEDGVLGIADANGGLTKIDPEGEMLWNRLSAGKQGWMLCADAQGFYHGHSKGVTLYDFEQGRQLWHQPTVGKVLFGCQQADRLYVATSGKQVHCFHTSGQLLMSYHCEASVYSCAVNEDGNLIYVGDSSGFIYGFDGQGTCLWKASTGCGSALSMQFSSDRGEHLYIATNQGILACLDVSLESIVAAQKGILPDQSIITNEHHNTTQINLPCENLKTTKQTKKGVLLECFRQNSRLRVRVLSPGYHRDWMVQFPCNLRQEGDRYLVTALQESKQGKFYRIEGEIERLLTPEE